MHFTRVDLFTSLKHSSLFGVSQHVFSGFKLLQLHANSTTFRCSKPRQKPMFFFSPVLACGFLINFHAIDVRFSSLFPIERLFSFQEKTSSNIQPPSTFSSNITSTRGQVAAVAAFILFDLYQPVHPAVGFSHLSLFFLVEISVAKLESFLGLEGGLDEEPGLGRRVVVG